MRGQRGGKVNMINKTNQAIGDAGQAAGNALTASEGLANNVSDPGEVNKFLASVRAM